MEPKTVAELQLRHIDTPIDLSNNNILLSVLFEFCIWQLVFVAILGLCTGGHWVARSGAQTVESRATFFLGPFPLSDHLEQASGLRAESVSFSPPVRPLALAPPQFYTANRVCDRLSQMVLLFGCPSFWQFFLSQNLILHKFSRVHLQMKILSRTIYSSGRGLRETTRRWTGETKIFRSSYDLQLENASSLF